MKEELLNFIQKEISYDASVEYSCDRCGNEPKRYWIDHRESLASNIAEKLGLKIRGDILNIIENASDRTNGKKNEDAEYIVAQIDDGIMGIK